ncbi:hypothetical protein B398_11510 [Xylella fastidiosa 32]|uniref:Uncharacterized protein n=1 Tax=Xylella fastidiosa (strain 9a5c) TaxID=160492 RepID=Q9PAH8_XYLFA|nr:hypothetical protein [Xylella fastidiosa]AAF85337.1 hypothetical protein XF_2540 [Xylella fastidiosa 9a5c]ETE29486.1 hypothetical protein B398_11510 [Xylella fastidiosa 32]MDG5823006.1 hypothetical protein [Xylella fastidiosa subsp. pauca]
MLIKIHMVRYVVLFAVSIESSPKAWMLPDALIRQITVFSGSARMSIVESQRDYCKYFLMIKFLDEVK